VFDLVDLSGLAEAGDSSTPLRCGRNDNNGFFNNKKFLRLFVVGRLDKNSRGLVLLTNDGDFAFKMTHPKFEHEKKYEVEITKAVSGSRVKHGMTDIRQFGKRGSTKLIDAEAEKIIKQFKSGVVNTNQPADTAGERECLKAKEVKYLGDNKFSITLTTGKKRQIRRMFKELGYEVTDLLRTGIGDFELGNLGEGKWAGTRMNTN